MHARNGSRRKQGARGGRRGGRVRAQLTQAQAALDVARQQTALAAEHSTADRAEHERLTDALIEAQSETKRWQQKVDEHAEQVEQLKAELLQAEERHIQAMDEFLESLRAHRVDLSAPDQ